MSTLEIYINPKVAAVEFRKLEYFVRTISEVRTGIFKRKEFNFNQMSEHVIQIIQNKYTSDDEKYIVWPLFFRENNIKEIKFATSNYEDTVFIDFVFNSEDDMTIFILAH